MASSSSSSSSSSSYAALLSSDLQRLASSHHADGSERPAEAGAAKKDDGSLRASYEDLRKLPPQSADLTRLMNSFADLMATLEPQNPLPTRSPKRPSEPSPSPEGKKRRVDTMLPTLPPPPPPLPTDRDDNVHEGVPQWTLKPEERSRSLFHTSEEATNTAQRQSEETQRALLQALHDERALRAQSEDKAQRATDALLEAQTQHEVEVGDHQLAVKRLKAQVRALCSDQPLADIYAVFEEHVTRLVNENEALRRRNLTLEARVVDVDAADGVESVSAPDAGDTDNGDGDDVSCDSLGRRPTSDAAAGTAGTAVTRRRRHRYDDDTVTTTTAVDLPGGRGAAAVNGDVAGAVSTLLDKAHKRASRLAAKLQRVAVEKDELRGRYEDMCKRERQYVLAAKQASDATRRLTVLQHDHVRLKTEYDTERQRRAQLAADLAALRDDAQHWQASEHAVRAERERYAAEVAVLRSRVATLEDERKSLVRLTRFVSKHAPPAGVAAAAATAAGPAVEPRGTGPGAAGPAQTTRSGSTQRPRKGADAAENVDPNAAVDPDADSCAAALDASLGVLHESLVTACPALLPLFRKVSAEVHAHRTRTLRRLASVPSHQPPQPPQHTQHPGKAGKTPGVDVSAAKANTSALSCASASVSVISSSAQGPPGSARKTSRGAGAGKDLPWSKSPTQPRGATGGVHGRHVERETPPPPPPPPLPLPLYGTALYKGLFDAPPSSHTIRSYSPRK